MFPLSSEMIKPTVLSPCNLLRNLQLTVRRSYAVGGSTTSRESRFLKKLMTGSNKKKKWHTFDQPSSKALTEINFFAASNKLNVKPPELPKIVVGERPVTARVPCARVTRRVGVLNTVFLEHITSILASGDLRGAEDVVGMGLEISYVRVMPDFKLVNVYWYTTGSPEKEAYLEELLKQIGPRLRHALITLRVMGIVPPVQFVKDTKQAQLMEVERLFETADYGENFVPTKGANLFRPVLNAGAAGAISEELKEKIEELENADSSPQKEEAESESESLSVSPPGVSPLSPEFMRQDILGLKRDRIMEHITDLIQKRKQRQNQNQQSPSTEESGEAISHEQIAIDVRIQNARTELFVKYLRLKQIENAKANELESTEAYERKFYNSLRAERSVDAMERFAAEAEERLYKNDGKEVEDEDYWSDSEIEDDDKHKDTR